MPTHSSTYIHTCPSIYHKCACQTRRFVRDDMEVWQGPQYKLVKTNYTLAYKSCQLLIPVNKNTIGMAKQRPTYSSSLVPEISQSLREFNVIASHSFQYIENLILRVQKCVPITLHSNINYWVCQKQEVTVTWTIPDPETQKISRELTSLKERKMATTYKARPICDNRWEASEWKK